MTTTLATARTLDLRGLDAPSRSAASLAAFDALEPGGSLVLLAGEDSAPLLLRFQKERPGRFEWSPLEEGPEAFRVEIRRRQTEAAVRGVAEALGWDHDRLEDLEKKAFEERGAGRFAEAAAVYGAFARGLRRHIGFEEDLLFPEFERRAGIPAEAGPTAVMRAEHRTIEGLIGEIERGIGDPATDVEGARRSLHQVLGDHNMKEERILYPGTDRLMTEDERDVLIRRIQAYRR